MESHSLYEVVWTATSMRIGCIYGRVVGSAIRVGVIGAERKLSHGNRACTTVLVLRMAHRKWKETKQQPSMLPVLAVPGCCLISFHIMWAILSTSTVRGWSKRSILGCVNSPPQTEAARKRDHAT